MEKPIRILHVLGSLNKGGAESRIMDIYRQIDRTTVQFDFALHTQATGHFEKEASALGSRIFHGFPRYRGTNHIDYLNAWYTFFTKNIYACVHIHTTNTAVPILCAAKKAGIPVRICHARSADESTWIKRLFVYLNRPFIRKHATNLWAVSSLAGEFAFHKHFLVLNNAIHIEDFRYSPSVRKSVRASLGLESAFVIGHVARFDKAKNHDFLLDCFSEIKRQHPHARLVLAGDGALRQQLEENIRTLDLQDSVVLLGMRDDIPALLQAFDLLVLPSLYEGMPGVAIEAQAAGLPCLLSDRITEEAVVLRDLAFRLPIHQGIDRWVDKISSIIATDIKRQDTYEVMKARGYDAYDTARWHQNEYLSLIDQSKIDKP